MKRFVPLYRSATLLAVTPMFVAAPVLAQARVQAQAQDRDRQARPIYRYNFAVADGQDLEIQAELDGEVHEFESMEELQEFLNEHQGENVSVRILRRDQGTDDESDDRASEVDEDRAMLGVYLTPVPDAVRQYLGLESGQGVYVGDVIDGTPAAESGLESHDVIFGVGTGASSRPVSEAELREIIASSKPGDTLTLMILRRGDEQTIEVELAPWDESLMSQAAPEAVFPGQGDSDSPPFLADIPLLGRLYQNPESGTDEWSDLDQEELRRFMTPRFEQRRWEFRTPEPSAPVRPEVERFRARNDEMFRRLERHLEELQRQLEDISRQNLDLQRRLDQLERSER